MKSFDKIIKESINLILNEAGLESIGGDNGKDIIEDEYDAIGFANKFYTLWRVVKKKYSTTYVYRKNISFSKEKAFALYPNAEFDEKLRGKTHSFTVSVANSMSSGDLTMNYKENTDVEEGQEVDIPNFIVKDSTIKMTRYNKPYYCITGSDLNESEDFDFVLNFFEKPAELPTDGDILSVHGIVSFFNEKDGAIYLKNCNFEFVDKPKSEGVESEEGVKFKKEPMVLVRQVSADIDRMGYVLKNGFIILQNENGEKFYIDTVVGDFRTGKFKKKFDTSEMNNGDKYAVSGTVQIKNGFRKLIRAKLELIEPAERVERSDNAPKEVRLITLKEVIMQGRKEVSSKSFRIGLKDMDSFFDYIWSYKEKYDAKIEDCYQCVSKTIEDLKDSFNRVINKDSDMGGYTMWGVRITIPQTNEKLGYSFTIYFKKNLGENKNISNMKTIRLTENQLHRIIEGCVSDYISKNNLDLSNIAHKIYPDDDEVNSPHKQKINKKVTTRKGK